ncbi:hypothetical protein AUK10_04050 [Candidatus Gracilibacteria bacterium CG2_30_37_12]|nr:MAG: hypothetical protein AUK10_04050 [Candidatus Gracilibacteria bacterium CG2_30_37_12]
MDQLAQFVDWKVMLVQVVNFAIIFYVLQKFVFKPLISYLDIQQAKQANIDTLAKDMEVQKADADKMVHDILEHARRDALAMKTQAETLAKKETALMITRANEEIMAMKAKAELDVANERKQMEGAMQDRILTIALKLNERLFGAKESNADFIKQAMKE